MSTDKCAYGLQGDETSDIFVEISLLSHCYLIY